MIGFDGIIFSLQSSGGISVLFQELISRLPVESYELVGYRETPPPLVASDSYRFQPPRLLERYRAARVGRKVDVFHSTYYRLPVARRSKVVVTVHDYTYERFAAGPRRLLHSFQKKRAIAGSDSIICVSECTRRDLLEFSGAAYEDRAVVIYNGAAREYSRLSDVEVLPQVIFVGMRAGYKNFSSVLNALSSTPRINLVCVGGGAFTRREIELMEKHVPGRYRHTGYLTKPQLNLEYNRSLCLIYPSLYEGFGIPIVEAMRAGCPVVAVNRSSIPEVAGDAAILMDRGHPDEIRQAIEAVRSTEAREDWARRGLVQSARFSWDRTFEQTREVYEGLLGKSL